MKRFTVLLSTESLKSFIILRENIQQPEQGVADSGKTHSRVRQGKIPSTRSDCEEQHEQNGSEVTKGTLNSGSEYP